VNTAPFASPRFAERPPSKPIVPRTDPHSNESGRLVREPLKSVAPRSSKLELKPALSGVPASRPNADRTPQRREPGWQQTPRASQQLGAESGVVEVLRGDSLWRLAERYLGRGAGWHELYRANPRLLDPNQIRVGSQIFLGAEQLSRKPPRGIRVQRGDTLWKIAKLEFGRGAAWTCIAGANPDVREANLILVGQELKLPQVCSPSP
jgi:nucleoid-associated protein YgaU